MLECCVFSTAQFRNTFETPIALSRDSKCSAKDRILGDARSAELARLTATFVLRRTGDVLKAYLPPRVEQVVFCKMSQLQIDVYRAFLRSKAVLSLTTSAGPGGNAPAQTASALSCLTSLKKVANDPQLVHEDCVTHADSKSSESQYAGIVKLFPKGYTGDEFESGKLRCLDALLAAIQKQKGKVVCRSLTSEQLGLWLITPSPHRRLSFQTSVKR